MPQDKGILESLIKIECQTFFLKESFFDFVILCYITNGKKEKRC
jgi:hypothetical protein